MLTMFSVESLSIHAMSIYSFQIILNIPYHSDRRYNVNRNLHTFEMSKEKNQKPASDTSLHTFMAYSLCIKYVLAERSNIDKSTYELGAFLFLDKTWIYMHAMTASNHATHSIDVDVVKVLIL